MKPTHSRQLSNFSPWFKSLPEATGQCRIPKFPGNQSHTFSLKSVGRFVVPLLEAWEGFNAGTSQSRVHTHPLQYVTRGYLLRSRTGGCRGQEDAFANCAFTSGNIHKGRKGWGKPCSRCRNKTHFPEKWAAKPRSPDLSNTLLTSPWLCSANSWGSKCCLIRPRSLAVI